MIIHLPVLSARDADKKVPEVLSILQGLGLSDQCITNQTRDTDDNGIVVKTNLTINLESVSQEQVESAVSAVFQTATYSQTAQAPVPEEPAPEEPATNE